MNDAELKSKALTILNLMDETDLAKYCGIFPNTWKSYKARGLPMFIKKLLELVIENHRLETILGKLK